MHENLQHQHLQDLEDIFRSQTATPEPEQLDFLVLTDAPSDKDMPEREDHIIYSEKKSKPKA